MAENAITSAPIGHNENSQLAAQSKEAMLNNNINRAFGRDISNLGASESSAPNSNLDKQEPQGTGNEVANSFDLNINDLVMADGAATGVLPKPKDTALLASRELLTSKQSYDSLPKADGQSKRVQKVPLNLFAMENCDILEITNPQYVSVYAKEIFENLQAVEESFAAKFGYIARVQKEINERMRAILVDWLVDVHIKFKLLPETLYLAVNLLDRYLEKVTVPRQKLQLVGVTAMLIASKYQEIYPPEVKDFVYVADKAYQRDEILEMEGKILNTLEFKLTIPSTLTFLERFSRITSLDKKGFFFSQYLVELALSDYGMLKYCPSVIAAGAIQATNKVFKKQIHDSTLVKTLKHDEEVLKRCEQDLLTVLTNSEKSNLKAVKRKFLSQKYMEVSKLQVDFA